MVAMPCSIRISKMIILSIEVGIVRTMVDVAAILLTQKSFFVH
jgi:HrpA-like RNA helicase